MGVVVVYYICTITLIYIGDNMITGELKNKIDDIWNAFWSGGITNPLTVVEQITYLMFIHDLGAMDDRKLKEKKSQIINGATLYSKMQKISITLWYMVYFHL